MPVGGQFRVVAGSGGGVSIVDISVPNASNVLHPIFSWCWDQSTLWRVSGSRIGISIANYGSLSGLAGVDVETGEFISFRGAAFTVLSRNGVDVYRTASTGAPVAIYDARGCGWTDDIQLQLGYTKYSTNAGTNWSAYLDEHGQPTTTSFYAGELDEIGGFLFGKKSGALVAGRLGWSLRNIPLPGYVYWFRIDHAFNRIFVGTSDSIYYASVADIIATVRPQFSHSRSDTNTIISFEGNLLWSTNLAGPWTPVEGATSPHSESASRATRFYRAAW